MYKGSDVTQRILQDRCFVARLLVLKWCTCIRLDSSQPKKPSGKNTALPINYSKKHPFVMKVTLKLSWKPLTLYFLPFMCRPYSFVIHVF